MLSIPDWIYQHAQTDDGGGSFDRVPDSLVLLIFNYISDIETLVRCRAVSKRFDCLVPQADTSTLSLKVDRLTSDAGTDYDDSSFVNFLRLNFNSVFDLVSPKPVSDPTWSRKSPARILRGFERIRELDIEVPSGDLRLEKGAVIRWRAEFGSTLKSCVILGFRATDASGGGGGKREIDLRGGGLKTRMVWTISSLIAASARHHVVKELARDHRELEQLVLRDGEEEGTVVMDMDGLRECRESFEEEAAMALRMRMRHEPLVELAGGIRLEDATLVVVRPTAGGAAEEKEEEELALGAFGGVYGEAVQKLLKSRSYLLEMNSSSWWWGV